MGAMVPVGDACMRVLRVSKGKPTTTPHAPAHMPATVEARSMCEVVVVVCVCEVVVVVCVCEVV
jgi:hypothetical protein